MHFHSHGFEHLEPEVLTDALDDQRMTREREAWREIQSERDALLEEKHRWAMVCVCDLGWEWEDGI